MKTIKHKGKLTRTFALRDHTLDEENRSIELSFSSESPVERWFGTEILDHGPAAVRLDRLNDGAALLVDHDTRDHVGVVESAIISGDRRGRATVRFGQSARADEIFTDVKDGIRRLVSVGYRIHRMVNDGDPKDETFRAVDWEPHEISIVAVPADASVGVGRTDEDVEFQIEIEGRSEPDPKPIRIETMSDKDKETPKETPAPSATEIRETAEKLGRDLADKQLSEWQKIRETAKAHGHQEVGERAIEQGKTFDQFRQELLDNYVSSVKPLDTSVADPDLSKKEAKRYSIRKVLNHLADPANVQKQRDAAFELEVSKDIANRAEHEPQGVLLPGMAMRDLTAGTPTDGAELVATNLLASSFIDVLRNRTKVLMLGAMPLEGLVGDVAIPRKTSGSAGGWIATEGADSAQSEPQFDQVTMTPRTVGAYAEYTRQLLKQSTPSIDGIVQDDLQKALALAIDLAALEGSGAAGQPTGLRNQTGVLTSTIAAAGVPTWVEIVEFETDVASANADVENMAWITRAEVRGSMKTTLKSAGVSGYIMEGNEVNGYRAEISQQAAANGIYFGDWSQILIGMWGGLDLLVDPYSNSLSGTVRVVALQSADVAVRHPEAFAINA